MTFLVSAYTRSTPAVYHEQHLITMAAVQRLIDLLATQTNVHLIRIRIIRQPASDQIALGLPQ